MRIPQAALTAGGGVQPMCTASELAHAGTARGSAGRAGLVPANAAQALAAVRAGLQFLATADAGGLTGAEQADLLRGLAAAESQHLAARSAGPAAVGPGRGVPRDAPGPPRPV